MSPIRKSLWKFFREEGCGRQERHRCSASPSVAARSSSGWSATAQGRVSCLNARTCAGGSHNPLGRLVRPDCHGYDHYRVFLSHNEFVRRKSHVNGIESTQTSGLSGALPSAGLQNSTVVHPTDSWYT